MFFEKRPGWIIIIDQQVHAGKWAAGMQAQQAANQTRHELQGPTNVVEKRPVWKFRQQPDGCMDDSRHSSTYYAAGSNTQQQAQQTHVQQESLRLRVAPRHLRNSRPTAATQAPMQVGAARHKELAGQTLRRALPACRRRHWQKARGRMLARRRRGAGGRACAPGRVGS